MRRDPSCLRVATRAAWLGLVVGLVAWLGAMLMAGPLTVSCVLESAAPMQTATIEWKTPDGTVGGAYVLRDAESSSAATREVRVPWNISECVIRGGDPGGLGLSARTCGVIRIPGTVRLERVSDQINAYWPRWIGKLAVVFDAIGAAVVGGLIGALVGGVMYRLCGRVGSGAKQQGLARDEVLKRSMVPGVVLVVSAVFVAAVQILMAASGPTMFCPDSMDYAVSALEFAERGSLEQIGVWRVPGYTVFLVPFLKQWGVASLPIVQGVLIACAAFGAGWCVRWIRGGEMPVVVVLLIGLDPLGVLWARHAMPEAVSGVVITLAVVCGLLASACRSWRALVLWAVSAGVLGAAACYLRPNAQVVVVVLPVLVACAAWRSVGWKHALVGAGTMWLVSAVLIAPWVLRTHGRTGHYAMTVGTPFQRVQGMWSGGVLEVNQSRQWSEAQVRQQQELMQRAAGPFEFLAMVESMQHTPNEVLTDAWAERNRRIAIVIGETERRSADRLWLHRLRAWANVTGAVPQTVDSFAEHAWWARPLLGDGGPSGGNFWNLPEHYGHLDAARTREVFERGHDAGAMWSRAWVGRLFGWMWKAGEFARPWFAWVLALGMMWRLWRGEWMRVIPGVVFVGHAAAVAVLLDCGIDRYQAPFWPIAFLGVALVLPGRFGSRT